MRIVIPLSLIVLAAVSYLDASQAQDIWTLGQADRSSAEFAASGDYASFPQRFPSAPDVQTDCVNIGAEWPWIHPGPDDAWAGNRAHTFTVAFDLPERCDAPAFEVAIDTVATHYGSPPVIELDLNGEKRLIRTRAGCRSDGVLSEPREGQPATYRAVFLGDTLRPKANRLSITNTAGSWLLYDCLSFRGRRAEIDDLAVEPLRGVLRGKVGQLCRSLKISYEGGILTEEADLSIRCDAGKVVRSLDPAVDYLGAEVLLPVDDVSEPILALVTFEYRGKTIERKVTIPPQRPWEVHLVHQTHLDIGYTHTQEDVLARQVQSLKDSLQYIDQTNDYPEEARFRFHPEGIWAVDEFMRTASDAEKQALVRATRDRDVHLDAMYAQAMTGMYNDEELFELMAGAARFGRTHNVVVDSAMQTDVPGYTWGLVAALAHNGVRYMTMGPNNGHRVGHVYHWADKPFWWESPSGKHRVLCWVSSFGYAAWHGRPVGHRIGADRMFELLDRFEQNGYPYDLVMLRYNIEGDNGRPNRVLSDCVKQWNKKYIWPKLIISRNSDVMGELERRHGDDLPIVRGDYTPYWEDGCASTSEATSLCRQGCERIVQAQTLFAMLRPGKFPVDAFETTWIDLIMFDEHTWGAHCSISQPDDPFTIHQDQYKQAYAQRGFRGATDLIAQATDERSKADRPCIDVLNTASWARTGIVTVAAPASDGAFSVADTDGPIPTQLLADRTLAFRAVDVPAFGTKRHFLNKDPAPTTGTAFADADSLTIGNDRIRLQIDQASGAIASLRCQGINGDLVKPGDDGNCGLNDYLYILERNPEENRKRYADGVTVRVLDPGPLVARLAVESTAPNCNRLVREITVFDGSDEIAIENRMDKIIERRPEGTFFGFPLNVPGGQWRIDVPWAVVRPEIDQLPGANRNYYCVQRWCDLSNEQFGVTWVTIDANMMQFAPIRYTPAWGLEPWRTEIDPGGTLYSWVCNNHWETNYKAGQEGPLVFRYVLRPHVGRYDQAEVQRFARGTHQRLLTRAVDANGPLAEPVLSLDNDAVVATCLKPTRDGRGLLLRLFNTTETPQDISIDCRRSSQGIWRSNPLEDRLDVAPARLSLAPYEIVTLRIE